MAQRFNSPDCEGVLHFVTLNVRERKSAFRRPEYAEMALRELRFECDRHPARLIAYVVMPDHLHFLFGPQDGVMTRFLKRFKPGVTLKLDAMALEQGRRKERTWLSAKGKRELWQDGKHSLPIYSPEWVRQKIEYIHENPVRAGLVKTAIDYPYSSVAAYFPDAKVSPPVRVDLPDF